MSNTINKSELNNQDRELLKKALIKNPTELNKEDVKVIRARRDYLTAVETEVFSKVLKVEKK